MMIPNCYAHETYNLPKKEIYIGSFCQIISQFLRNYRLINVIPTVKKESRAFMATNGKKERKKRPWQRITNYSTSLGNEKVCEKPYGQRDRSLFIGEAGSEKIGDLNFLPLLKGGSQSIC